MPKPEWKTLRCVVEYRTPAGMSEIDLARYVQGLLDADDSPRDSKLWAKGFNKVVSRMIAARPRRLASAARALDAVADRLRRL